jgi:hypothetical protein
MTPACRMHVAWKSSRHDVIGRRDARPELACPDVVRPRNAGPARCQRGT